MKTGRPIFVKPYAETLRDVIQDRAVLRFNPKDSVSDVLSRLRAGDDGAASVVGTFGAFMGLVTEKSVLRGVARHLGRPCHDPGILRDSKVLRRLKAADVMIAHPDTLDIDDSVDDAFDMMTYLSHRYMPVLEGPRRLAGIVSAEELKRHMEKKAGALKERDDPLSLYMMQQELWGASLGQTERGWLS